MNILHLANWNSTNIGNGALILGTERVLSEDAPYPIEFISEAWDDYTFKRKHFDHSFVDLVNRHDALLINGAVTFNAFRQTMIHTGMRFNLPLALWDQIRCPIIFYGVSYRCWPHQKYFNAAALKRTIEYAIARPDVFFGVRNDGTKEWLRDKIGVDSPRIVEVPDPGLFVPSEDHAYPELHPTRKNILVSLNGEDSIFRYASPVERSVWMFAERFIRDGHLRRVLAWWGGPERERMRIVRSVARALEHIMKEIDAQIVLVPHYLDDYGMIEDLILVMQERIAHQRVYSTGLLGVPSTAYFYGRYKKADLALSMRVHSMSPSIGLNTPVIPITSQGRMRNFLNKAALADIALDVRDPDFAAALARRSIELLQNPQRFKDKTARAVSRMRDEARAVNRVVFETLQKKQADA